MSLKDGLHGATCIRIRHVILQTQAEMRPHVDALLPLLMLGVLGTA